MNGNSDDVNPPVHAWGVWQVYKATGPPQKRDKVFLARAFQKLLSQLHLVGQSQRPPRQEHLCRRVLWDWTTLECLTAANRLPHGHLEQADGTAWMAFYCGTMLRMAIELAEDSEAYGDMASKFFEHYVAIAEAMNSLMDGTGLWDEEDGFYYDHLYIEGQIEFRCEFVLSWDLHAALLTGVILEDQHHRSSCQDSATPDATGSWKTAIKI